LFDEDAPTPILPRLQGREQFGSNQMLNILRRKLHSARIRWHRAHALGVSWHGGEYLPLFVRKHLLNALLRGAGLATVTDLALVHPDRIERLDPKEPGEASNSLPEAFFANLPSGRYFLKTATGEHGRDAGGLIRTAEGFEFNGRKTDTAELMARYSGCRAGFLVQRWQEQHPDLARFSANTLNTLRILTLCGKQGAPRVMHSVLRLGRSGAWLDNFHAGGIALRVDLQTGRMIAPAVRLDRAETYTKHPDSGLPLDAQPVPEFDAGCQLVRRAHALFDQVPTIGWDIAIAPDGPRIVEANLNWDAEIHAFTDTDFRRRLSQALKAA